MAQQINNTSPNLNTSPGEPQKKTFRSIANDLAKPNKFTELGTLYSNNLYYNTGFGESSYDEGFNFDASFNQADPLGSINESRARTQPWYDKAAAGIARIGTKAVTEILKMPGFIVGSAMAPFAEEGEGWDTAVNNQWIKALNNINEDINTELLPVYVKKSVSEGNLWDNISSIDFWATEGADGIGYIASMFAPGAAFKALSLGEKAMGLTAKGLSLVNGERRMAGAIESLANLGIKAETFDVAGTAMANTLFEAGSEAGNAMDNFQSKLDRQLEAGEISQLQYDELLKQKGKLGRDIFVSNMGILLVPNLIQSKMIWGKSLGKELVKQETPSLLNRVLNRGKNVVDATLSEGFLEEAGQSTVENMFTDKALKGKLTDNFINDFSIGELADSYLDTISSTEGQKAMFLGAFLGGGMSAYHGAKSDKANRENTNKLLDFADTSVTNFNTLIEQDTYKRDQNGDIVYNYNNEPQYDPVKVVEVAKALQFTEEQNQLFELAAQQGNTEVLDILKQRAVDQLIIPFASKGEVGIKALEQYLNTTSKSPEIVEGDRNNETKTFINDVLDKAKYLQTQYEAYQGFSRDLINLKNPKASLEDLENYYNQLADLYIYKKGQEYTEKKTLNKLKKDKQDLLREIQRPEITQDLNPDYIEGKSEEIYKNTRTDSDPRIKLLNNKIDRSESNLRDIDNFVNDNIWNSKLVNEAFNNKLNENDKIREEELKTPEFDILLDSIDNITDIKELDKIDTSNPQIAEKVEEKRQLLQNLEDSRNIIIEQENSRIVEETLPVDQNPLPNKDIELDGNINEDNNIPVTNGENDITINSELKKVQPGAKVISTNRKTGNKFDFVSQEFLDYERTPRDKSKDKVKFEVFDPEVKNYHWNKAIDMYDRDDWRDLEFLYKHLPIEASFPADDYIAAPIETLPSTEESIKIFNSETLPLRKNIIDALANGAKIEDLSSNIIKQFPGELKVDPQIEENGIRLTPENNVLDLQVFEGLDESKKIKEFVKRAYYVGYDGQLTNVIDKDKQKGDFHKGKGEIFLEIPQNNGKPFMLKLNFKRIDNNKANSIFEIVKALSQVTPTVDNPNIQTITIDNFLNNLDADTRSLIEDSLGEEINLINNNYKNTVERTIEKLLDLLVFQNSTNSATLFRLDNSGNLELGTLSPINRISKENLNTDEARNIVIEFLKNKRHNVLITKDEKFMFNNPNYIKYLLNNKILSTNAVVNQPTFQGYSNIYLNPNIKGVPKNITPTVTITEDVIDTKTMEAFNKLLAEKQAAKSKKDVKLEVEQFNFDNLDPKSKAKLLFGLRKELGITLNDDQIIRLKNDQNSLYKEMVQIAKDKNRNIDEIIKRCGF